MTPLQVSPGWTIDVLAQGGAGRPVAGAGVGWVVVGKSEEAGGKGEGVEEGIELGMADCARSGYAVEACAGAPYEGAGAGEEVPASPAWIALTWLQS